MCIYISLQRHKQEPTANLEALLPLLLHRRPPTKPPRHSLARSSRSHVLTTIHDTTKSRRSRTRSTLWLRKRTSSSISRFTRGRRRQRLAGTNNQLRHLATSQHLHLACFGLFALPADVALCFAVGARTLFFGELRVGFLFARALGDGAGCGDPIICFRICAGRPVGEQFGQVAREGGWGGFGEGGVLHEV